LEQEILQQNIVQKITEHIKGTITKRPCPLAISTGIRAISAALPPVASEIRRYSKGTGALGYGSFYVFSYFLYYILL